MLTVGYWPTTYWPENYWDDDYWQDYGEAVATPYPLLMTLSESVEYGINLSESVEYNIVLSESGGGE